jgi:DNA-binding transcriptional LysR family regulator
MFDLTRLRIFRELAHRGTMTAAGAALGLSSSAVSQQVGTLEREAKAKLLERVGRRVRLTAEGQRLARHADTILQAVELAALDLTPARGAIAGTLEVACFPTFAKSHLLPAAGRACRRHPGLSVLIRELEPVDAVEAVRNGPAHLAITFAYSLVPKPEIAGLVTHPLLEEPVLLALPKQRRGQPEPFPLARVADADWIVGSRQTDDNRLAERACAIAGFAPRIRHTIDDYDLLLRMVEAGFGIGFVPELALRFSGAKKVAIRTASGPALRRKIQAVTRPALATSPLVAALLAELDPKLSRRATG